MYHDQYHPRVKHDVKKLHATLRKAIHTTHLVHILDEPEQGEPLVGDLKGIWSYHFSFGNQQYRIAYMIDHQTETVIILMIGKRAEGGTIKQLSDRHRGIQPVMCRRHTVFPAIQHVDAFNLIHILPERRFGDRQVRIVFTERHIMVVRRKPWRFEYLGFNQRKRLLLQGILARQKRQKIFAVGVKFPVNIVGILPRLISQTLRNLLKGEDRLPTLT